MHFVDMLRFPALVGLSTCLDCLNANTDSLPSQPTQMKTFYFPVSLFLGCCFVSLLTGCQQPFPSHLTASKKGDTVELCLSNELKCPQPEGVSPSGISFYRYA